MRTTKVVGLEKALFKESFQRIMDYWRESNRLTFCSSITTNEEQEQQWLEGHDGSEICKGNQKIVTISNMFYYAPEVRKCTY